MKGLERTLEVLCRDLLLGSHCKRSSRCLARTGSSSARRTTSDLCGPQSLEERGDPTAATVHRWRTQNGSSESAGSSESSVGFATVLSAGGVPKNCTRLATISVRRTFEPLFSHSRVRSRPSTKTCRPFLRYSLQLSASLPMATIWCHCTPSWRLPSLSRYRSSVAREKFTTGRPLGV